MSSLLPVEKVKREILNRIENPSISPKFGADPGARAIPALLDYGIVNLDKPEGPTSHQVSYYVQEALGISKSGHSGTLDPNVTGVLPVALGRATRVVQALLSEGKEYVGIMHLHKEVTREQLETTIKSFVGKIKQLPPIRSNVKRQTRFRKIYYFDILEFNGQDVLFRTGTQAGTYIRKLCHDIGQKLGTGAHMSELRRTKVGHFNEGNIVTLQDLKDAYWCWKNEGNEKFIRKCILPMEQACLGLGKIYLLDSAVDTICHGANLAVPGIARLETGIEKDSQVALMTLKGELIALGKSLMSSKDIHSAGKGLAVKTDKVFMPAGTYPKMQKV